MPGRRALIVFAVIFAALFLVQGNLLLFANDEGLTLESSQRVLAGQRPYADFFGHASPGSYWAQALLFRIFGTNLGAARAGVVFDVALLAALLFWMVARYGSTPGALICTALFLAFETADPVFITIQHRWNSAAFSMLSIVMALAGAPHTDERRGHLWWIGAGAAAGFAALCTPTVGLIPLVTLAWLLMEPLLRRRALPFSIGLAAIGIAAAGYMAAAGMLTGGRFGGYLGHLLFMSRNYAEVNRMPYGAVIGGYRALFEGASGAELGIRAALVGCLSLPAVLPVVAACAWTGWIWTNRQPGSRRIGLYLLACLGAYAASAFPRADLTHLAFFAAFSYALTAIFVIRALPRAGAALATVAAVLALGFAYTRVSAAASAEAMQTPIGQVHVAREIAPGMRALLAETRPGETMYVYPYMPLLFFVTQTRNPASFCFLAPGMMKAPEENAVLRDLTGHPPRWMLYHRLSREEFLHVFPAGVNLNHRYERMEDWIERNYRLRTKLEGLGGYDLLENAASTGNALLSRSPASVTPPISISTSRFAGRADARSTFR